MSFNIAFLPGDGVGPEVAASARAAMEIAAGRYDIDLTFDDYAFGGAAIDQKGEPLPDATKEGCAKADAVFLGAVGGPKWEGGDIRPEAGLLALRQQLGLFANLRPTRLTPGLEHLSPLKPKRATGVDLLIVRELIGGLYFGERQEGGEKASDQCVYTRDEVVRVARVAFEAARLRKGRVTSVDKANVLATSRLWRSVVNQLHTEAYADVILDHMLVDAMAMQLIQAPSAFDVILTENLFGDILSDEASVIAGSIGLAPSASLGESGAGLYEPIHGSAPDIAGMDKANPVGAILSGAMLFRYSLDAEKAAMSIERAVEAALAAGGGGADIGGKDGCRSFTDKICTLIE